MGRVRIATFNVNGIRSFVKHVKKAHAMSLNDFLSRVLCTDILCVQETRASEPAMACFSNMRDYAVFNAHDTFRQGRSGVSTFVSRRLCCQGASEPLRKGEGRALLTDHGSFSVLNLYFPYMDAQETRPAKRDDVFSFYEEVGDYVEGTGALVLCGDFNAVYEIRDHYQFVSEYRKIKRHGTWGPRVTRPRPRATELPYEFFEVSDLDAFLVEVPQRLWLRNFIRAGTHVDSLRVHRKEDVAYTCWNTFLGLRSRGMGTRIDLVLVPRDIPVLDSGTMPEIQGSDHCPSYADISVQIVEGDGQGLDRGGGIFAFLEKRRRGDESRGIHRAVWKEGQRKDKRGD